MAKSIPQSIRQAAVAAARTRENGVTLRQVAAEFGVHPVTLGRWLRDDSIARGALPRSGESAQRTIRDLQRQNRRLQRDNQALLLALSALTGTPPRRDDVEDSHAAQGT